MLNQAAVEALYSATYVENYLDCVENLPDDLQRLISRMRELDVTYQAYLKEVEQHQESSRSEGDSSARRRNLLRIQQSLIAAQEVGDEKLQIVQQIQDLIENKSRQLDLDYRNLDFRKDQENHEPNRETHNHHGSSSSVAGGGSTSTGTGERQSKRARRTLTESVTGLDIVNTSEVSVPEPAATRSSTGGGNTSSNATCNSKKGNSTSKKKKRKSRQSQQQVQQQREDTPPQDDELAIDPDEPTYCLCDQISYGEMILCDNDLCPIEWFHFSCVALATKPKGKWFCPKCRGDRPNVMKPKAQFLKELERYNKEKEEKA
ncbi:inhibitor of growth protein 1 [Schistocerca americana]|uniref:inhibitor of growth protein 1 n=1 Tax=Schistocerca americana TaxID=7009 RepID=UPI001F4F992A|nr:inhibitor of growth protein 1 [Schistocerca americana]XP_047113926.1 inhibitor of growth protein 1 [Schistocerca piceifrons]XP_049772168.1 inhibitor of growth protein 1 [Schistocerca cancellata]XP_049803769.1 inhibitor of growth protein 1 [Schistocerca nitens]XP_049948989.1 inhibitor of growth protein 1 [Schistocerca serialis cubense]